MSSPVCQTCLIDLYRKMTEQFRPEHFDDSVQRDVYIWANYSVSCYLNFIPIWICWNVLIWLKYDFIHIFMHHLSLYFETTAQIPEVEFGGKYGYIRANMDIWGQKNTDICTVFALRANNQHWLSAIIGHAKTNILQQNMW